jgi:predicted permease
VIKMNAYRNSLVQLRRRPGFSFVVIAMLAVGIGATTAMFSLFQGVLLKQLPVPEPEHLVKLGAPGPKPGDTTSTMAGDAEQIFSYPMFRDLEARQGVLSELAGHYETYTNLAYDGQTRSAQALLVSGGYFAALRALPALGRLLGPQDDARVGDGAVAVLGHDYWQNALGADPHVVGRTLIVNGQPLTIVGVAPEGFTGTTVGWNPSVYVPLTMRWLLESNVRRSDDNRLAYWIYAFGRLKPGVSLEEARASLGTLYSGIINEIEAPLNGTMPPEVMAKFRAKPIIVEPGARGQSVIPSAAGAPLTVLLGVTGVVLLIVCLNVASLMLARGAGRAGELAVRSSIGASRFQLVRDLLLESGVLALLGGLASIPITIATLRTVVALLPADAAGTPGSTTVGLSSGAAAFAAALSLATVVLFGLLPALQVSAVQPGAAMKGRAGHGVGGRGVIRFGRWLATIQIVFAMMLLAVAGLFAESLANLARADLGMNIDSLVTFSLSPRRNGYSDSQATQLFDRLERELAAEPGVTDVASSMVPLITRSYQGSSVKIGGHDPGPNADSHAARNLVSPDFFRTLAIPVLAGRAFTDADSERATPVAVVNESFTRKFRLEAGAIGKRVSLDDRPSDIEIVGVIADAKYGTVRDDVPPQIILPRRQDQKLTALSFYVRAATSADDLMRTVKRVVAAADPNLPVTGLMTMDKVVEANLFLDRLIALLAGGFAALATLLAATGLYGVLAYGVGQRTREIGLRLALGATTARLRVMVLKQLAVMAGIGIPIGLALAVLFGRGAEALLFGLKGYDPLVLAGAVIVLVIVVLLAAYLPARRAAGIAPMEALRSE